MEAVLDKLNENVIKLKYNDTFIFWNERFNRNKGIKEYELQAPELRTYLKKEGFRNYQGEAIRVVDNIAKRVNAEDIFKHTLKFVESFEEPRLEAMFIKQGESLILKNKAILISLFECELNPLKDSRTKSYKCFLNGIVVVEANKEFNIIPYEKAKGFVWEDSIKDRKFKILEDSEIENAVFGQFLKNVTNNSEHYFSICTAIGYLIHTYKDQRKPIAVIINDENLIDEGKPEGGTGKGLIVKAISHIVQKASYNGKNADFSNNKFAYQNVDENTAILLIDDAPRNFDFESLFSVLTDDFPVEKKHQPVKVIPYESSPKFVITTNYTIKGSSSSFKRRRFDIFLNNNYHASHTPADDFGDEFFHGWDETEWNRFDLYMIACLRSFLSLGLCNYEDKGLRLKMLKNETSPDFFELMEDNYTDQNINYSYVSIREKLIEIYGEKYYFLKRDNKIVVEWVEKYADYKGLNISKSRNGNGATFLFPGSNKNPDDNVLSGIDY